MSRLQDHQLKLCNVLSTSNILKRQKHFQLKFKFVQILTLIKRKKTFRVLRELLIALTVIKIHSIT